MTDFNVDLAYAIAERMVRSAMARDVIHYGVSQDDYMDFVQEAVAEMWQAFRRTNRVDARYLAGAARAAIRRYALRLRFGRSSVRPGRLVSLDAYQMNDDRVAAQDGDGGHTTRDLSAIREYLVSSRRRNSRSERAADREMAILALVLKGYRNDAIAGELEIPVNTVKTYRQRIRNRLRAFEKERKRVTV